MLTPPVSPFLNPVPPPGMDPAQYQFYLQQMQMQMQSYAYMQVRGKLLALVGAGGGVGLPLVWFLMDTGRGERPNAVY